MNQELQDYIKQARDAGHNDEQIRQELLNSGWSADQINGVLHLNAPLVKNKLSGPFTLLKETLGIYKKRFTILVKLVLVPIIIFSVASVMLLNSLQSSISASVFITFVLVSIVGTIYSIVITGATIKMSNLQENLTTAEYFRLSLKMTPALLLVLLFSGLAVLGGFLLLLIPGLIFGVWFSLSAYSLIHENLRGRAALLRSKELAKGYWWAIFGRILFYQLFLFVVLAGIGVFSAITLLGGMDVMTIQYIVSVVSTLVFPLSIFYPYLIYENLTSIKGPPRDTNTSSINKFIVIGIIAGILLPLATITLLALNSARIKARDTHRIADTRIINFQLDNYYYKNGNIYPKSLNELQLSINPVDPLTGEPYEYTVAPDGQDYRLCYNAEETKEEVCFTKNGELNPDPLPNSPIPSY